MAKINEITPNIRQFTFRQERDDPDFGSCVWASFILDCENYDLCITSDCGIYSYAWVPTPQAESFVHLMNRIHGEYLLEKISQKSEFDYEKSLNQVVDWLKDAEADDGEIQRFREHMEWENAFGLVACDGSSFADACTEILTELGYEDIIGCDEYNGCVYDYPAGAKKIVEIFCEYLQPLLKEDIENENNH